MPTTIGTGTYNTPKILYDDVGVLEIGNYCMISEGVTIILAHGHSYENISMYPFDIDNKYKKGGKVTIGHGVWIGYGATILPDTVIGNGAVIGARSVVKGTDYPYSIVAGNPARGIKYRFPENKQREVEETQWWLDSLENNKKKGLMVEP